MSDLIRREDALKALSGLSNNTDRDYCNRAILALPAAQPHVNETPKSEHDAANMLTLTAERDRLRGALADIVSWETMHANATVTRMANHARYALKRESHD